MHGRIYKFLIRFERIRKKIYGLMRNTDTTDALKYVLDIIYEIIHDAKAAIATFIDLSIPFDTFQQDILLHKLEI